MTTEAFIYDALRTPRGRGKADGALHAVAPVDLLVTLFHALEGNAPTWRHSLVDDIVLGCVTPIGEQGGNIARTAALYAGWDLDAPGMQINRFCASGLETVNNGGDEGAFRLGTSGRGRRRRVDVARTRWGRTAARCSRIRTRERAPSALCRRASART
jgi:hypothetical protein